MPRTEVWAGARRKAAPGKAAFRRPSRRSIKVWICRYERAPLTIARIENRITPACPYIFPSARRRSGMAARQVRRSVVISNLRVGLLAMDSDRLPLRKRKDVLHGAAATFLSDRALNSPAHGGDQARGDQAVFDGRRAGLILQKTGHERVHGLRSDRGYAPEMSETEQV